MRFGIIEETSFTEQVAALGDVRLVDDALTGIQWNLGTNPYFYKSLR